jgi:hypothetical protein
VWKKQKKTQQEILTLRCQRLTQHLEHKVRSFFLRKSAGRKISVSLRELDGIAEQHNTAGAVDYGGGEGIRSLV